MNRNESDKEDEDYDEFDEFDEKTYITKRTSFETHRKSMTSMTNTTDETGISEIQRYQIEIDSPLIGKFIQLKNLNNNDIDIYEIQAIRSPISEQHDDGENDGIINNLPDLMAESTNSWLFLSDIYCNNDVRDKNKWTNFSIAIIIIIIQIAAYGTLVYYWISTNRDATMEREETCYGPNCSIEQTWCMYISTGIVTMILLIGFLWVDIINTFSMIIDSVHKYNKIQFIASIIVLLEILAAIICGIYVGMYSPSEFDSINGAVGILFVHDLDEKIYAAMIIIQSNYKKIIAIITWIILSIIIAVGCSCIFPNAYIYFRDNDCKQGEFACGDGECIWEGFVCNGNKECLNGYDEMINCDFSLINCPLNKFKCESTGTCIDINKRCDGILDCDDSSDESRQQNCSLLIDNKICSIEIPRMQYKYEDNYYYFIAIENGAKWKCNNGQCIDTKFMCDGIVDCLDGTDEYPNFYSLHQWPWMKQCPYHNLIECSIDEVLCKQNGKCISKTRICDNICDCSNCEDERDCNEYLPICGILEQGWIKEFRCNGNIAFYNDTDIITFNENIYKWRNSNFSIINDIYPNYNELKGGKCIPWEWRCDGMKDCDDGSDEKLCQYFQCNDNDEFQCNDGRCIPIEWKCDYYNDCFSGNDELNCHDLIYNEESNAINLECNKEAITNIVKHGSDYSFYFKIYIECDAKYKIIQFTTCNEYTLLLNTKMTIWRGHGINKTIWENTNGHLYGWPCRTNIYASTITLTDNDDDFLCDALYTILIQPEILKQTFGEFGINVICNHTKV